MTTPILTGKQWISKFEEVLGDNAEALLLIDDLLEAIPDFKNINDTHIVVPNEENMTDEQLDSIRMLIMVNDVIDAEQVRKALFRNPRTRQISPQWFRRTTGFMNKAQRTALAYALLTREYLIPKTGGLSHE